MGIDPRRVNCKQSLPFAMFKIIRSSPTPEDDYTLHPPFSSLCVKKERRIDGKVIKRCVRAIKITSKHNSDIITLIYSQHLPSGTHPYRETLPPLPHAGDVLVDLHSSLAIIVPFAISLSVDIHKYGYLFQFVYSFVSLFLSPTIDLICNIKSNSSSAMRLITHSPRVLLVTSRSCKL